MKISRYDKRDWVNDLVAAALKWIDDNKQGNEEELKLLTNFPMGGEFQIVQTIQILIELGVVKKPEPDKYESTGCPVCGSNAGSPYPNYKECGNCGSTWNEIVRVIGYDNLVVGHNGKAFQIIEKATASFLSIIREIYSNVEERQPMDENPEIERLHNAMRSIIDEWVDYNIEQGE